MLLIFANLLIHAPLNKNEAKRQCW